MCGIAGIFSKREHRPSGAGLAPMLDALAHRGPDAAGVWEWENLRLGHKRLAIIDTSDCAGQPMHYKDLTIVFNGEIYNYLELKAALRDKGHVFVSHSDTEVLLHAYEQWGQDCLDRLLGMWAFMLCDRERGVLFCARDCFGIKPFYYSDDADRFIAASEPGALLSGGVSPTADMEVLAAYLVLGLEDYGEKTFFSNIRQLLPGQKAVVDLRSGKLSLASYYSLRAKPGVSPRGQEYTDSLRESVKLHLRSDVPVGTCLSGGLDSSVIAALASGLLRGEPGGRLAAVTGQSEAADTDETRYAGAVARWLDLDWHPVRPDAEEFAREIEDCLFRQGEPVGGPSVYLQYRVMRQAKEAGMKVMLDGQGGDEVLLGYERYYAAFFRDIVARREWLPLARELVLAVFNSGVPPHRLAAEFVYFSSESLRRWMLSKRGHYLKRRFLDLGLRPLAGYGRQPSGLAELQVSELMQYQLGHLLRYEDRNSMAQSIEARVPFVYRPSVEIALALPGSEKIRNGYRKRVLREFAATILPGDIAWRKRKIGFETPEALWLGRLAPRMRERVRQSPLVRTLCEDAVSLDALSSATAWRLYNIAVWEEQYGVHD